MISDLKLKGNDCIVYAIIYWFSQWGNGCFNWSLQYLVDRTNASKRTIQNVLNELVWKNLITKNEKIKNWIKYCEYKATSEIYDFLKEGNHEEEEKERIENKIKSIKIKKDLEEYKFVDDFINKDNPTIQYLTKNENRILNQYKSIDLLNKDWYSNEAIQLALQYIKQDDFRSKNILTIEKLRRKNKDGVPYIVVILELIKNRKPKIIDLDK